MIVTVIAKMMMAMVVKVAMLPMMLMMTRDRCREGWNPRKLFLDEVREMGNKT